MITAEEESFILEHAYIPEHSVRLMTRVSGGDPFLVKDFFGCRREDWVILVGYPLRRDLRSGDLEDLLAETRERFNPGTVSLMAPEIPPAIGRSCTERERDDYYVLDVRKWSPAGRLKRAVDRASESLTVEPGHRILDAHRDLIREFLDRVRPPRRVENLFYRMSDYVGEETRSVVLDARDRHGNLAAFYVVDMAPRAFSTYVIGAHSRTTYVPGASDLLCFEMIRMSMERGKERIHLGLGVNPGIRRFKEKWGGRPAGSYDMGELVLRRPSILEAFRALGKKI